MSAPKRGDGKTGEKSKEEKSFYFLFLNLLFGEG